LIAHIRKTDGITQPLEEHITQVGDLCQHAAAPLGLSQTALLLGLLHDMGKATADFETYLLAAWDHPATAASPHHHAPTGAIFIYHRWFCAKNAKVLQRFTAQLLALCVYGHHAGLMDCLDPHGQSHFLEAMQQEQSSYYTEAVTWFCAHIRSAEELDKLFDAAQKEIAGFIADRIQKQKGHDSREFQLGMLTRLLLSLLVDADRWDAACFEYQAPSTAQSPPADWDHLLFVFESFREKKLQDTSKIGHIRAAVSDQCFAKATQAPGIYTLCVPTGGGKTYSSLRYALRHAARYHKQRIFYIIPYNTILDQNAQDIRQALADYPSILEHHSNVVMSTPEEQENYRHLTERWDSDIILTSLVQFLDACFSAPNTNTRRLHRLTNAILIFDEIQSLPKHCKTLFEQAITFLSNCCGSTVILCTATQPQLALTPAPTEIMPNSDALFEQMKRVSYVPQLQTPLHNDEAAARLAALLREQSVLTIVNTKTVAREVYQKTVRILSEAGMHPVTADAACSDEQIRQQARQCSPQDILCVHLSTLLCPAHRKQLIRWVKIWLKEKARVFCISTALIEAGINVSFPVVVRSLNGLPSIVQAAGRANRSMEYGSGTVLIWHFCDEKLTYLPDIQNGGTITRAILSEAPAATLDTPAQIATYFSLEQNYTAQCKDYPLGSGTTLYDLLADNPQSVTAARNFTSTRPLVLHQSFRTAYRAFEVIPDITTAVLVPFGAGQELIEQLNGEPSLSETTLLLRQAQMYSVSLHRSVFQRLQRDHAVWNIGDTGLCALEPGYYDPTGGVMLTRQEMTLLEI